ncbi:DUF6563 family protein [Tellurirhabdus rosea]|uniref:DUF6563 family protein n=1 Tax=Tellurirhabdus rosea TaxID=2674997 RepID=UPI0022545108|nr:DUF6563 family protein [Tellurirhabdus rosea]
MKQLFTACLCLFAGTTALGQTKTTYLDLPFQQISTLANRQFYVDSLFDARPDTARIGTLQKSSGKSTDLDLKGGFLPSLRSYVYMTYNHINPAFKPVVVGIQEFDLTANSNRDRLELGLTFFVRDSARNLVPVFKAEIINESGSYLPDLIRSGLEKAFTRYNQYVLDPVGKPAFYSDFDLEMAKAASEMRLESASYPEERTAEDHLLTCQSRRMGIYQDFDDLQRNRPTLVGGFLVQADKDFATVRKPSGGRAKYRFYGFSIDKDLYLSTALYANNSLVRRYVRVRHVGRYLLWVDDYVTPSEAVSIGVGVQFGVVGVLISNSTRHLDCIALDMESGAIFRVTKEKMEEILAAAPNLLEEYRRSSDKNDEVEQFKFLRRFNKQVAAGQPVPVD